MTDGQAPPMTLRQHVRCHCEPPLLVYDRDLRWTCPMCGSEWVRYRAAWRYRTVRHGFGRLRAFKQREGVPARWDVVDDRRGRWVPADDPAGVSVMPPFSKRYEILVTDRGLVGAVWVGASGLPEPERAWTWDAWPATPGFRFDAGCAATAEEARDAALARLHAMYEAER